MPEPSLSRSVYAQAERSLPWRVFESVLNPTVKPNWLTSGAAFWYRRQTSAGHTFVIFDVETRAARPLFDHAVLAQRLAAATGEPLDPAKLPVEDVEFAEADAAIRFKHEAYRWSLCTSSGNLQRLERLPDSQGAVRSPDGRYSITRAGHDLELTDLYAPDQRARRLTHDGELHFSYAKTPDSSTTAVTVRRSGQKPSTVAIWSPDSTKVVTYKLDERDVEEMQLIQSAAPDGAVRPCLFSYKYPLLGDAHVARVALCAFDIVNGRRIDAAYQPLAAIMLSPIEQQNLWWGEDSRHVYFIDLDRDQRAARFCELDTATGSVRTVLEERSSTFLSINHEWFCRPNVRVLQRSNEVIWHSERDGWGHLYLYDLGSGALKRQLTHGPWIVREILDVDEESRSLLIVGSGREPDVDPYLRTVYRVSLDEAGEPVRLTPDAYDHLVHQPVPAVITVMNPEGVGSAVSGISPCRRYFVETTSRADCVPVSLLRDARTGAVLAEIEKADMSNLAGWRWPQLFTVRDSQDRYELHGTLFLPPRFDPKQKYPIIESIYPGPQLAWTAKAPFADGRGFVPDGYFHAHALSELGFIVLAVDAPGTPLRSKAFHDVCFGRLQEAGELAEHIHVIRTLAESRPYMDLERIGIYGHSGGGYAATRAVLKYPDFYKVAVASASDDDMRGYLTFWAEKYQGPLESANFAVLSNAGLADGLSGHLLMIISDLDDNTSPSMNIKLIDALVKANKDFDLLILPNESHMSMLNNAYMVRRRWDYFVRRLLGADPPAGYRIRGTAEVGNEEPRR